MDPCARCGHALGVGRFCVNCGHPVGEPAPPAGADDWRVSTAERPAVPTPPTPPSHQPTQQPSESPWGPSAPPPPAAPPPAFTTPPQVRYPLFADEPAAETTVVAQPPAWESAPVTQPHRSRRSALPWVLVAVALLLVAASGVFLLVRGDDDPDSASDRAGSATSEPEGSATPSPDDPDTAEPPGSTDSPGSPDTTPSDDPEPDEPTDVARGASVTAPSTAKPSRDVDGNAVRYDAVNMLDGQVDTAWRTAGDAAGSVITFALEAPTSLQQVGLVNGYAKSVPGYDGYSANRRITSVEWVFDDGTVVPQTLGDDRAPQLIDVDAVTTSVELRILAVSRPAKGPAGRDFTAISEVSLLGVPD